MIIINLLLQSYEERVMHKTIKWIALISVIALVAFFVYSLTPRVTSHYNDFGQALEKSDILDSSRQKEMSDFVLNEANRMHVAMAVYDGKIVFEEGETDKLINCHSARKSIMSLLVGIAVDKGYIDLDETIGSIGIDESHTPLTESEKSATVRDILMCTSGIFLQAEAEHDWQETLRPNRGEYMPGEYFYYNNFDFNIMGVILEKKTEMSIGEFMEKYLAEPLRMEDFRADHIVYDSPWPIAKASNSDHPVYWMFMSARDFAKIGVLIVEEGTWNGTEVVSKEWLDESLYPYSKLEDYGDLYDPYEAFSYSWWNEEDTNTVWADGFGGQFLSVDREHKIVMVQRNYTGNSLLSSGLFLMDKNKDNNPKSDLIHLYDMVLESLNLNE